MTRFVALNPDDLPHVTVDDRPDTRTLTRLTEAYDRRRGLTASLTDMEVDAAVDRLAAAVDADPGLAPLAARRIPRQLRRVIVLPVAALVAALSFGGSSRAEAAVIPLTGHPITVTVSGPTTRVDTTVISTGCTTRDGGHIVTLTDGPLTLSGVAGSGWAETPAVVHVGAAVPSWDLTPGTTTATLTDIGDGATTRVPVTVLRQSRVTVTAHLVPGRRILVTGTASHYDPATGTYRGDVLSPVLVQVWEAGRWVTAATVTTTGTTGAVAALLTAPAGTWPIRLVRPAGATVTGATSAVRVVTSIG